MPVQQHEYAGLLLMWLLGRPQQARYEYRSRRRQHIERHRALADMYMKRRGLSYWLLQDEQPHVHELYGHALLILEIV